MHTLYLACTCLELFPGGASVDTLDCGGQYHLSISEDPDFSDEENTKLRPVYKHVSRERYIFYLNKNWVCGKKDGLTFKFIKSKYD